MPIYIRNSTPNLLYVAVGYFNEGCSPRFGKRGWYHVQPGTTAMVFGGRTNHSYFRYYAEDDFGHVWGGDTFTDTPEDAFDMCWIANCPPRTSCNRLGFANPGYFDCFGCPSDRLLNLVLTSSRRQSKSGVFMNVLPTKRRLKFRKHRHGNIKKLKSRAISKRCKTCKA